MTQRVFGSLMMMLAISGFAGAQKPQRQETLHTRAEATIPIYHPVKRLSGELTSAGSETMVDVMKLWIEGFARLYPNLKVNLETKGIMTAMPALADGGAQMAAVSRDLMPFEIERFRQKFGYDPTPVR